MERATWEEGGLLTSAVKGRSLPPREVALVDPIVAAVCLGGAAVAGAWFWRSTRDSPSSTTPHLERVFSGLSADRFTGARLANWRLLRPVGRGASAVVYRAVPDATLELSEACAIKVLHPEVSRDPSFRARFQREVQVLRTLSHPHIVRLDDFGEFEGLFYLVTELVNGLPLRRKIRASGLSAQEAGPWLLALAETLSYAHGKGIIHRNLKPENIIIRADGFLKLFDFGLARPMQAQGNLTLPGAILGTPAYMAPEQVVGQTDLDGRCDQYALGVLLHELLTGRRPFTQVQSVQLLYSQVHLEPPSLLERRPDLSPELDRVYRRMLCKAPEHRYSSMQELLPELKRGLGL